MQSFARVCVVMVAMACAACATGAGDDNVDVDGEALNATADAVSGTFVGLYATSSSLVLQSGDISNLELRADGSYVRMRCYHPGCALAVPETDHYDTYSNSSGKTYLRFYSFRADVDAHGERTETRAVADVYEMVRTSTTIKLRKSYTSRWITLRRTTPHALCTADGGTWNSTSPCLCPGAGGWSRDGYVVFAPGAGGCAWVAGADESACDESGGFYTDDDSTLIGTYCRCELGQYLTNDGCSDL